MKKIIINNFEEEEEYMTPQQMEYFKKELLKLKADLVKISFNLSDTWEAARQLKAINEVDEAIRRIDQKTYGYCEITGEEIGIARLKAKPTATLCIEAQEKYENYQRQHNEE